MNAAAQPVQFVPTTVQEDAARADFYAVLARLWYAAPDRALLATLAAADELAPEAERTELADAWRALCAGAAVADEDDVRVEYDDTFVGTGRAPVSPYATAYFKGTFKERILVQLRDELAGMGLARAGQAREPEDHFAALCDVMRHLIAEGSGPAALERQKGFFQHYIAPAYAAFADAALAASGAKFYRPVARFTRAFCDLEVESFQMVQQQ